MFSLCSRSLNNIIKFHSLKMLKPKRHKKLLASVTSLNSQSKLKNASNSFQKRVKWYSTNVKLKVPVFIDSENTHMYNILQTIRVVDKQLFSFKPSDKLITTLDDFNHVLEQDWRTKQIGEIVDAFKSVSNFCSDNSINISDTRFDKLVDGLMDNVQNLTDHDLSDLLTCLATYPPCESYMSHNFHDVWSALDDVCCWRVNDWSHETMFWFAERWYKFNMGKLSEFLYLFTKRMDRRIHKLSKEQLLHMYFYSKILKRHELPFEYQAQLNEFITEMSLDEISVATTALVEAGIKPKFQQSYETMIQRLKENLPNAHQICIINTLQVLRYSSNAMLVDQLMDLLDHLVPEIDRLSIVACIHIALLGTTLQFFHKESLAKVSEKVVQNIDRARLKDLERLLLALTMFDFDPKTTPDIFTTIYNEIHTDKRTAESVKYQRCVSNILSFLSIKKRYSNELMDRIFDPEYILNVYGKAPRGLGRDVFSLDVSRDIECPDYNGNRLNIEFRRKVTRWNVEYIPQHNQTYKLTSADKFTLDVTDTVSEIVCGHKNVHSNHILPNYAKADIVICKNEKNRFIPPVDFDKYTLGDIMYPPDKNLKWYAIVPLNWNMTIRGTLEPLGLYNMKCRQLKTIGYEPILVISNEFTLLTKDEKINYIASRIR